VVAGELSAQLQVVVELTVLDCPDPPVLVADRLVTALDVDDAEPADAECDPVDEVGAAVVGPAVGHDVGHPVERLGAHDRARVAADLNDTADSTHAVAEATRAAPVERCSFVQ
jgi:hypothetical protein